MTTPVPLFAIVAAMNNAFGNNRGNARELVPPLASTDDRLKVLHDGAWERLGKQCDNIGGKANIQAPDGTWGGIINGEVLELQRAIKRRDLNGTRDALCDIMVFALGAFHIAGLDADGDMLAVVEGVMTRFCKNEAELEQSLQKWRDKGVEKIHTRGSFPTLALISSEDQTAFDGEQIPKGKFLKPVGYRDTVFPALPEPSTTPRRYFGMNAQSEA